MLTPAFELTQDRDFLTVAIRVPHARASEFDVYFEGVDFKFYAKPYFLRRVPAACAPHSFRSPRSRLNPRLADTLAGLFAAFLAAASSRLAVCLPQNHLLWHLWIPPLSTGPPTQCQSCHPRSRSFLTCAFLSLHIRASPLRGDLPAWVGPLTLARMPSAFLYFPGPVDIRLANIFFLPGCQEMRAVLSICQFSVLNQNSSGS